ncbi:von Willebrand factor type A domain protein [Leptospira inadai serovar Lyme str. 10]|uniref:von Willebrand factor type A domain protein n=2 Tax=Leptospira inadai serovar Lyme TaxID=293084 RepID=V6HTL0_9LEPT|nr:VWA domain-containing protein [Leptospira inadai]EQA36039.1 von Willebrand factor type A domain protein [Leptospira inadai serovar Lyme str. 10]PNV77041.1 aerotolerance regulator BatB [Leptospira inadai serovar Lyme]
MTDEILRGLLIGTGIIYLIYVLSRAVFYFFWRSWVSKYPGLRREASLPSVFLIVSRLICLGLALILCAMSFQQNAGPKSKEEETLYGVDFLFLVDVSLSMQAIDTSPTRLVRAKETILRILPGLTGNRFGMIVFAATPFVYCPMTSDVSAFADYVRGLDVDMVGDRGTDLDAAFRKAEEVLRSNRVFRSRVVVLITDGEDAQNPGVFRFPADLIVWSVGTLEGGPIAYKEEGAILNGYLTRDGSLAPYENSPGVVRTRANESFLKSLAEANGGEFLSLNRTSPSSTDLMARVRFMDKNASKRVKDLRRAEGYRNFLLPAFLLLLFDFIVLEAWGKYSKLLHWKFLSVVLILYGFMMSSGNLSAVELDPGGNRVKEGNEAYEEGNFPEAVERYKEAESYFPGDPRLEFNRGTSKYKTGDLDTALRHFEKALESKDTQLRSKAYFNLGNTYLRLGDRKKAAESFLRSLKENPKQEAARKNLEWLRKLPPPQKKESSNSGNQNNQGKPKGESRQQEPEENGADGRSARKKDGQRDQKSKSESDLERMMDSLDLDAVKRKSIGSRNREVFW